MKIKRPCTPLDLPVCRAQKDFAELGPIGIIRETSKLFWSQGTTLLLILVTLVIPTNALLLAFRSLLDKSTRHAPDELQLAIFDSPEYIGFAVVDLVSSIPWIAATTYTAGCSYVGKSVSFSRALRSLVSEPHCERLMRTAFWGFLVTSTVMACLSGSTLIVFTLFYSSPLLNLFLNLCTVPVILFVEIYGTIISQVANGVAAMEETFGWDAVMNAIKLLKGKLWTALGLFVTFGIPAVMVDSCMLSQLPPPAALDEELGDFWWWHLLTRGLVVILNSFLAQWGAVMGLVLYFSCKVYHHEIVDHYCNQVPLLPVFVHFDYAEESEFQRIGKSRLQDMSMS